MGFNWKQYIPTISWKKPANEDALLGMLVEQDNIITGLNISVGLLSQNIDSLKGEALALLSAITMQHGGELRVKQEFFEAIRGDDSANLSLKIEKDGGDMILKLEIETEESNAEETNDQNERNQQ